VGLVGKSWVTIGGISLGFSTRIAMPEVVVVVLWVLKPGGTMRFGTRTDSGRVSGSWTPEPVAGSTLGVQMPVFRPCDAAPWTPLVIDSTRTGVQEWQYERNY
jgi:hypothetical protein